MLVFIPPALPFTAASLRLRKLPPRLRLRRSLLASDCKHSWSGGNMFAGCEWLFANSTTVFYECDSVVFLSRIPKQEISGNKRKWPLPTDQ